MIRRYIRRVILSGLLPAAGGVALLLWLLRRRRLGQRPFSTTLPKRVVLPEAPESEPQPEPEPTPAAPEPGPEPAPISWSGSVSPVPEPELRPEPEPVAPEPEPESAPVSQPEPVLAAPESELVSAPVAPEPDDLTALEGIGPKISGVLQASGVRTFAQLAAMDVAQLKAILKEGGIRIANADTWPEQAALAARGDWDGLATLQGSLKGGRRA